MPNIKINNLSYSYKTKKGVIPALNGLSLEILTNKINVILGYSGSGKTTLLRILSNLLFGYTGDIKIDNEDYSKFDFKKIKISYVTQEFVLYPHLTIFDNLAFPLKGTKMKVEDINDRVVEIADYLGLKACLTRRPKYLSKGQQQRVALGKALIRNPDILILDEPFSNSDAPTRQEFNELIKLLQRKYNWTVIFVTHDTNDALYLGDVINVINEGKLEVSTSPKDFIKSNNEIVRSLLGN